MKKTVSLLLFCLTIGVCHAQFKRMDTVIESSTLGIGPQLVIPMNLTESTAAVGGGIGLSWHLPFAEQFGVRVDLCFHNSGLRNGGIESALQEEFKRGKLQVAGMSSLTFARIGLCPVYTIKKPNYSLSLGAMFGAVGGGSWNSLQFGLNPEANAPSIVVDNWQYRGRIMTRDALYFGGLVEFSKPLHETTDFFVSAQYTQYRGTRITHDDGMFLGLMPNPPIIIEGKQLRDMYMEFATISAGLRIVLNPKALSSTK